MVLDSLSSSERKGLVGILAVVATVSLAAGYLGAGVAQSPGSSLSADASTDEIRSTVQSVMDQQMQRQQQQLALMARQNENMSAEDFRIEANVQNVTQSEFESLYEVSVSVRGRMPAQQQSSAQVEAFNQEQVLYISKDGRYLFQEPTDLEAQQQTQQGLTQGQQPSSSP